MRPRTCATRRIQSLSACGSDSYLPPGSLNMSQYPDSEIPQPRLRTMQIIAAAMIIGPLVALAIFAVVRPNTQHPAAAELPIVTYVGVAFAAMACISQFIVPRLLGTAAAARITG